MIASPRRKTWEVHNFTITNSQKKQGINFFIFFSGCRGKKGGESGGEKKKPEQEDGTQETQGSDMDDTNDASQKLTDVLAAGIIFSVHLFDWHSQMNMYSTIYRLIKM